MTTSVARAIEDYFWHVEQYDEWENRYIPLDKKDKKKQTDYMEHHKKEARNSWYFLSSFKGRRVIVDGITYEIESYFADRDNWNTLIKVVEREVVA